MVGAGPLQEATCDVRGDDEESTLGERRGDTCPGASARGRLPGTRAGDRPAQGKARAPHVPLPPPRADRSPRGVHTHAWGPDASAGVALSGGSDLQLPNFRGHAWASMGKSSSCMGHSAEMVRLQGRGEDR